MNIDSGQMRVIQNICKIQKDSLRRVFDEHVYTIYNDLYDNGYEATIHEITTRIIREHKRWKILAKEPNRLFEILDDLDLSILRHHLFTEYYDLNQNIPIPLEDRWLDPNAKALWKKLNLKDNVDKFPN